MKEHIPPLIELVLQKHEELYDNYKDDPVIYDLEAIYGLLLTIIRETHYEEYETAFKNFMRKHKNEKTKIT